MMNNINLGFDMDKAVEEVLAIIERTTDKATDLNLEVAPQEKMVTYDGYGTIVEVDGIRTHKGKKAKAVRASGKLNDGVKNELQEICELYLKRVAAFSGKVYTNVKDGIVIRMADADYAVKVSAHKEAEFDVNAEDFKLEKNFTTRGSAVNHSSAIAKVLLDEIQNQNPDCSFAAFGNENSKPIPCIAKASGIRVQIEGKELTIKISKKRSRCIIDLD